MENNNLSNDSEYIEIIEQIKSEYKSKIESEVNSAKKELSKASASALGKDFAVMLAARTLYLDEFGKKTRELLETAVKIGLKDDVMALSKWSDEEDRSPEHRAKGTKLFNEIVSKVFEIYPEIANALRDVEKQLKDNNNKIVVYIKERRLLLQKIEKEFKEKLQKKIVALVVEFNKKIQVVNEGFGIKDAKPIPIASDFIEDLKFSVEEEGEFFIPTKTDVVN